MMKKTFLAEVQPIEGGEIEWLESSNYTHADQFAVALDQEGYIVKQVIAVDDCYMW